MIICYFGDYNPNYTRNRVIIRGLKENGVDVLECNVRLKGFRKFWQLIKEHKKFAGKYDFMIIGYSDSRYLIFLAKFLTDKPVIWDAFYSLYDSWVFDRKIVRDKSPKALYLWFLDWINCKLADLILLDTNAHIDYFVKTFGARKEKFVRVLIGADDKIFHI